jgi:hypothetical protein
MTKKKKEEPKSVVTHKAKFDGPVHGPVHTGSGDIHIGRLQYGIEADDLSSLFEALRTQVEAQAPPDKKNEAVQRVDALQEAIRADEPDLGMMESVLNWFKKNIPQLAGAITSVILSPIVGKIVEAAGELVAAEFKRRFGG